jgi:hypothetical protein
VELDQEEEDEIGIAVMMVSDFDFSTILCVAFMV